MQTAVARISSRRVGRCTLVIVAPRSGRDRSSGFAVTAARCASAEETRCALNRDADHATPWGEAAVRPVIPAGSGRIDRVVGLGGPPGPRPPPPPPPRLPAAAGGRPPRTA